MKQFAVITSSRADYGLLKNFIKKAKEIKKFKLHLVVTGTHLSRKFGYTAKEISKDRIKIEKKIFLDFKNDKQLTISLNISKIIKTLTKYYLKKKIALVFLLGDRYEILAAALASVISGVKIAHIHGGEITEGSMDELFRHSITKLSNIHFVASKTYRKRVIQLGENPKCVINVGAMCNDTINKILKKDNINKIKKKNILISYHPENISDKKNKENINEVLKALKKLRNFNLFFTSSNADKGNAAIMDEIKKFVKKNKNSKLIFSYGHENFLKKMKDSLFLIGNSSSGIIEAPLLGVPSINIGLRQKGRLLSDSIYNCVCASNSILETIKKLNSNILKNKIKFNSQYKSKNVAQKIINYISQVKFEQLTTKPFFDVRYEK